MLSGELSSRLTGRFVEIPVFGLDFNEFCTFHNKEQNSESMKLFLKSQKVIISVNTVLDYLGYLAASHLAMPVKRLDIRGKKTFEVGEKYYFQDTVIRNALFGYRISDIGQIMENVVWHHLVSHRYEVFTGDQGGWEIDFVAIRNNERIYIQVAYLLASESTIARESGNLLEIRDNYRKIVVSMDDFAGGSQEGIEHVRLIDFLKKFD